MKKNKLRLLSAALAAVFAAGSFLPNAAAAQTTKSFYVDAENGNDNRNGSASRPLRSVQKALEKAYTYLGANENSSVTLYLNEGEYQISDSLEINEQNLNGGSLTVKAAYEAKPVISGGKEITGWTLYDAEKNIYSAKLPGANPRQLYINGKRAVRARTDDNYLKELLELKEDGSGYECLSREPCSWSNADKIELVYYAAWANHRCRISAVRESDGGSVIEMANGFNTLRGISWGTNIDEETPYYIENAYEFLDTQREFYVDTEKGEIFYIPSPDEDMSTVKAVYPTVKNLLKIKNLVIGQRVKNVTFENITFMYSDWQYVNEIPAFIENQNNIDIYSNRADAAVLVEGADNIRFSGCSICNTGGSGITFQNGISNCFLDGCNVYSTAAGAITFGSVSDSAMLAADKSMIVDSNTISDCTVYDTGLDYRGAAAITIGAASNMQILHNEIYNTSYSGIHIGWGWNNYSDKNVAVKNISVKYNYIHDILVSKIYDGGAVYTLGKNMGGCVTSYNYIKNQYRKSSCLYNDEGTNDWVTHHNVVDNSAVTTWTPVWMHWHKNTILRCHMYDNYTDSDYVYRNSPTCVMDSLTVVSDGIWPDTAKKIMESAGVGKPDFNINRELYAESANDGEELLLNGGFERQEDYQSGWILNPENDYSHEYSFEKTYSASAGSLKISVGADGEALEKEVSLRRCSYYHLSLEAMPQGELNNSVTVVPYIKYNGEKTYFDEFEAMCGKWTSVNAYFMPPVLQENIDYTDGALFDTYTVGFEIKNTLGSSRTVYFDDAILCRYNAYYNTSFKNAFDGWSTSDGVNAELCDFDAEAEGVKKLVETGDFPDISKVARFSSQSALQGVISQKFAFEKNTEYDVSYWIKAGESGKRIASVAFPCGTNAEFSQTWPYAIWAKTRLSDSGWTHVSYRVSFGSSDTVRAFDSVIELRYTNADEQGENAVPGSFYMAEFKVEKTHNLISNPYFLYGSAATRSEDDCDWSKNIASGFAWDLNAGFSAVNNAEAVTFDGSKAYGSFLAEDGKAIGQDKVFEKSGEYKLTAWVKSADAASFCINGEKIDTEYTEYNGWRKISGKYYFAAQEAYNVGIYTDGSLLFKDFSVTYNGGEPRLRHLSIHGSGGLLLADRDGIYNPLPAEEGICVRGYMSSPDSAVLILAEYSQDGQLSGIYTEPVGKGAFERNFPAASGTLKLFVWNSILDMSPVEKPICVKNKI